MSYRPITDTWILARPKVKYYGSYPGGFPERARRLLGVSLSDPLLHVCGGKVRSYPYPGAVGPNDKTIDLDPNTFPDFCIDVRKLKLWPIAWEVLDPHVLGRAYHDWPAVLCDPPYTAEDARHYLPGEFQFPKLAVVFRNCCEVVAVGGRVGILHYEWPRPPGNLSDGSTMREVAVIGVGTGRGQRARWFTVWEKLAKKTLVPTVTHAPEPQQQQL